MVSNSASYKTLLQPGIKKPYKEDKSMLSLLKHYFMNLHRCNHSYMVKLLYRYDVSKVLSKCLF